MSPETSTFGPAFRLTASTQTVVISFEGTALRVPENVSVVAALLVTGYPAGRRASGSGAQRSAYCGIGQCFDCTMTIDGVSGCQACMTRVREGMQVARQRV
ncbi:(2Fe-2S)-binding protein [Paracoccus alcaliphilus]|uniref:(2Fe-2S)-binding protein n=1 Tax=Paracoccus alcaliphilus TaxID=34002 RepID=UPI000B8963E5|nr:(2Fe-2S)-binding protein [Paracoccus alcaliphilus]WCR21074.1 (2Fe-2S)-binding protein [Paracoccus alcaliphilus]